MYENEKELQDIVCKNPNLLKSNPQDADIYFVDSEITVSTGRIDALCIDKNGTVLIVETKLNRNPESKREVLAQVFDYLSAIRKFSYSKLDQFTNEKLGKIIEDKKLGIKIVSKIEQNLNGNGIRLVIVLDKLNDDLKKLISTFKETNKIDIDVIAIKKGDNGDFVSEYMEVSDDGTETVGGGSGGTGGRRRGEREFKEYYEVVDYWNSKYINKTRGYHDKKKDYYYHVILLWTLCPHYEFLDYSITRKPEKKIGVEFHIEKAQGRYPKLFEELKELNLQEEGVKYNGKEYKMEYEPTYWSDAGRIRIVFPYGTPKETICEGMALLINKTKDFVDKKIRK